ncbi:MAG: hypothetical protein ACOH19_08650 [Rhodoglobus sp.]
MSYLDESTLGAGLAKRSRRSEPDDDRRVLRDTVPHRSSFGTGFIGVGATIIFALRGIYGFGWFVAEWDAYPSPIPALTSWLLLTVVVVSTIMIQRAVGDRLPTGAFVAFLVGLALVIALDLIAIWPLHDIGRMATASVTAGTALLVVLTSRRTRDILIASAVIGLVLAVAIVLNVPLTSANLGSQISVVSRAVLPIIIGVIVVDGFRRLVQFELDRVLVQSTVSAPRFAVGMMASEELARLDLAAEELLESVATGKTPLPLEPRVASVAASLATELRLHLIEGRRETWLYHAIQESDLLGKSVSLTDKSSLAGLLDPQERDGLLAAAWLLVSDAPQTNASRTVTITIGPASGSVETSSGRKITIPIVIETTGVPRARVDPAIWDAIGRVGRYADSSQDSSLRVDIACLVDNPADR